MLQEDPTRTLVALSSRGNISLPRPLLFPHSQPSGQPKGRPAQVCLEAVGVFSDNTVKQNLCIPLTRQPLLYRLLQCNGLSEGQLNC